MVFAESPESKSEWLVTKEDDASVCEYDEVEAFRASDEGCTQNEEEDANHG